MLHSLINIIQSQSISSNDVDILHSKLLIAIVSSAGIIRLRVIFFLRGIFVVAPD